MFRHYPSIVLPVPKGALIKEKNFREMKNLTYLFSFLGLLAISLLACNSDIETTSNIPTLLDRPEAIQNGNEWDKVQNTYAAATTQIRRNSNELESYLRIVEVFILEARVTGEHGHYYPGALRVIDELLAKSEIPQDIYFQALSLKSSVLLSQHEFQKALICGQEALRINPYNAQIYGILTDALVELGQYKDAVRMADKMVSLRPDLRSYSRISYLREIHGDVDGAIEAMKMAVKAGYPGYEQSAWTRLTLGDIYNTYGQLDKAQDEYKLTLAERENYPFAIGALAAIELKKENFAEAEKLLKEACSIIPEFSFYVQLAELYQATDRVEEYQKTIEEIFVMLQDDVDSGHNMNLEYADIHLRLTKDFEKALTYTETEYKERPENIDVNRMLAMIHYEMGNKAKSKTHFDLATKTNSKHPDLVNLKGQLASIQNVKSNDTQTL